MTSKQMNSMNQYKVLLNYPEKIVWWFKRYIPVVPNAGDTWFQDRRKEIEEIDDRNYNHNLPKM